MSVLIRTPFKQIRTLQNATVKPGNQADTVASICQALLTKYYTELVNKGEYILMKEALIGQFLNKLIIKPKNKTYAIIGYQYARECHYHRYSCGDRGSYLIHVRGI